MQNDLEVLVLKWKYFVWTNVGEGIHLQLQIGRGNRIFPRSSKLSFHYNTVTGHSWYGFIIGCVSDYKQSQLNFEEVCYCCHCLLKLICSV